jgi:hypothetical protein
MKRILSILLILGLLATPAIGQEAAKNRIFVMNNWSGGLATKLSDQTTNPKYAQIAENIRLDTRLGSITKRPQLFTFGTAVTATEPITSIHRLYLSDLTKKLIVTQGNDVNIANDVTGVFTSILALATADYRWKWVTWHNLAIGGDGYNNPIKYDGTTATYLGTCAGIDSAAGTGPVAGTYTYKVTFYTTTPVGYEVSFNVASAPVVNGVGDHDISLTQIPIGPTTYLGETVVGRKVYRNKLADQTHWFLLSTTTVGIIANNTATTLTDTDTDAELTATTYPTTITWTPPKCKFWVVHKNRLFGANTTANPSRVFYSKDGSHDLFETAIDYRDIRANDGDEVTGLFNLLGILRIPKTNTWQSMYTSGDDPDQDWSISDPLSFVGCDAPYSAVSTPRGIIYLSKSRNGIYVFNGQASQLVSEIVTPVISDILSSNLNNVTGEYNNNLYYMAYASTAIGGSVNNKILVYDAVGNSFTIDTLNINTFCSLSGGTDGGVLVGGASDSGKVYQFSSVSKEVIHKISSDFSGTFDDTRIIPIIAGGDLSNPTMELAWDLTINNMTGTFNANAGVIDRPDTGGTYISPVMNTQSASAYDKIYWNESLASGEDVTMAIRSGSTSAACTGAAWSATEYTSAGGSDISGVTANEYTQYRLTLSTGAITTTPTVNTLGGYTVKLKYNTVGTAAESAVALHWQTGWLDFSAPGYIKTLRKIIVTHAGTSGTLTLRFTNEYGEFDEFNINLSTNPERYENYFAPLSGTKFKIDIINSDLPALEIKEIVLCMDVEPFV